MAIVRQLIDTDAEDYAALRRASLREAPLAFAASPETDVASRLDGALAQIGETNGSAIFGAFDGGELAGAVGVLRPRHPKARHKVYLWGMYVRPERRGSGIGAALLTAAIAHARRLPDVSSVELGVTSAATAARALYERFGFQLWGVEPDALRHDGASVSEYHMSLSLLPSS